jgi:pyruvate/2-oxoglutarate dehydrogenase complex dihydrolipoamide acyltransferase (E2) component
MVRNSPALKLRPPMLRLAWVVVTAWFLLANVSGRSGQNSAPAAPVQTASNPAPAESQPAPVPPEQKSAQPKSSRDEAKTDAAQLSALADQLHDEMNKSNIHVLSLDILQKTEQIEKLARKIKGEVNNGR